MHTACSYTLAVSCLTYLKTPSQKRPATRTNFMQSLTSDFSTVWGSDFPLKCLESHHFLLKASPMFHFHVRNEQTSIFWKRLKEETSFLIYSYLFYSSIHLSESGIKMPNSANSKYEALSQTSRLNLASRASSRLFTACIGHVYPCLSMSHIAITL